jgi:tRNA (cmo5U34)-methyltransferase
MGEPLMRRREMLADVCEKLDVPEVEFSFAVISAGAAFYQKVIAAVMKGQWPSCSYRHHMRVEAEWRKVFAAFYRALRPSGSIWAFDLVESSIPAVQKLMWQQYGEYLIHLKDEAYRDHVFAYVEKEDTADGAARLPARAEPRARCRSCTTLKMVQWGPHGLGRETC